MPDLKSRIHKVLGPPQLSEFATVTLDAKPWVRYVMTVADDNLAVRFASFKSARKVKQIQMNPEVHITCGAADLSEMTPYLQIQGLARFTTDENERHGFWNEGLAGIFEGPDDPNYGVIIVEPYRIEYCSPGSNTPEVWTVQGS